MPGAVVTLADGIPKVVDRAVKNLNSVKEARKLIFGALGPLQGISDEANRLIGSLILVKDVASLQPAGIGQQAYDIMDLAARLNASMLIIGAENRRLGEPRELRAGDHEYIHLATMLGQLRSARTALTESIIMIRVGISGSARDGFRVARDRLLSVNNKVSSVLGTNLALYDQLYDKIMIKKEMVIELEDSDAERLGLPRLSGLVVEEWRTAVGNETGIARFS
ncbi:hypothetical protein B0T24DRAFT_389178 [Lasiosphaeria ovina]|uniref:Uncharacterized protein n=1 Tax=Lasiosphaeria ovina TaxID=92902 RepID=A0AAE0K0Y6_9PEZI|nr:hypothetical protein B0T24DRAFT_389178 [Lasiosphaeria ovina]